MSNTKTAKMVVMGDVSVGKSSILTRYVKETFDTFSESTIGAAFFNKEVIAQNSPTAVLPVTTRCTPASPYIPFNVLFSAII